MVRLALSLGWPSHQMVERQAQEAKGSIMQLLEYDDGGKEEEGELLGLDCPLEKRSREEVEEDRLSLLDEEENKQRGEEETECKKGEVWRRIFYMITNYPGPNSIHSPVKVIYPDEPLDRKHPLCSFR